MKLKVLVLLLLSGWYVGVQAQKQFFTTKGKEIIGVDGKQFLIRGINLGNWLVPEGYMFKFGLTNSPRLIDQAFKELVGPEETRKFWKQYLDNYITAADIHFIRQMGANSIRIPFNYRLFTDEDYLGGRGEARGFALLDRVINWCRQEKLYVILDMHCAPGGQTGDNIDDGYGYPFLFDEPQSQQQTINIWQRIAQHYRSEEMIMGYDLLNEPIAHFFDSAHFNPLLEPLYKRIVTAIRQVDPNHLVFIGGAQWDSNFKPFGSPFDPKLVYTFHKYWTSPTKEVIQQYIDFSNKYQVPIYCGETGENNDEWVTTFRKLLEDNNIGWHYWPYKKPENTKGIVQFQLPEFYSEVIRFAETPKKNFEEVRKARPKNSEDMKKALQGFLSNCRFENCTPNKGYIEALGFKVP